MVGSARRHPFFLSVDYALNFCNWHLLSVECNSARRSVSKAEQKRQHAPHRAPFRCTARSSTAWVQELMLGGHYGLGPARQCGGTLGGERVNAALNPGEPAVDIAQENAGGVWDD